MNIVTNEISGANFSKKAVQQAIAQLKPTSGDIIFFYYSGHGFRYSNDTSKYPRMSYRTNAKQNLDTINLSVEEVYTQLLAKQANVSIVISDCCNNNIGIPFVLPPRNIQSLKRYRKFDEEACKALFFPTKTHRNYWHRCRRFRTISRV